MAMKGRSYEAGKYKYGFNTQEKDDELYGEENSTSAEYWQYDARLGRRWNVDPVTVDWESPFSVNGNNPISYLDPNGDFKSRFGAYAYKVFHGGEVHQNKNQNSSTYGQWFVSNGNTSNKARYKNKKYDGGSVIAPVRIEPINKFDWEEGSLVWNLRDAGNGLIGGAVHGASMTWNGAKGMVNSLKTVKGWVDLLETATPQGQFKTVYGLYDAGKNVYSHVTNLQGTTSYKISYGVGIALEKATEVVVAKKVFNVAGSAMNKTSSIVATKTSKSLWPAASGGRTVINGIEYTTHALERMQPVGTIMKGATSYSRGIPPSVVEHAGKFGKITPGNTAAEVVRTFDNVRVITNPAGTKVISVIKIGN